MIKSVEKQEVRKSACDEITRIEKLSLGVLVKSVNQNNQVIRTILTNSCFAHKSLLRRRAQQHMYYLYRVARTVIVSFPSHSLKENVRGSGSLLSDQRSRLIGKDRDQAASRRCQKLLSLYRARFIPDFSLYACYMVALLRTGDIVQRDAGQTKSKVTHAMAG